MADLIQIENFINKYNDNVLSEKSLLKGDFEVNLSSNTGSYSITNENSYSSQSNCLEFTEVQNVFTGSDVTFDFGTQLQYDVLKDASYIFQFTVYNKVANASISTPINFKLKLFVNSVLIETYIKQVDIKELEEEKYYTFAQSFLLQETDIVNFAFEFSGDSVGTPNPNFTFNVGGFKLEIDDKFIGLPTPYSLPKIDLSAGGGWAYYVDSLATPTISVGTSFTQITIDALGANITDYLPEEIKGISELFSGNKITPVNVGDDYDGRFDITIESRTGSPSWIQLIVDISDATAGDNVVFTSYIQTLGTTPYRQSTILDFFSLTTFLANGGKLFMRTDSGSVTIGTRNLKISRKAR